MKIKIYFAILIASIFITSSCSKYGTKFMVKNESAHNLDAIIISNGPNSIQFKNIGLGETKKGFIDFSKNTPKYDGNYKIEIHRNDTVERKFFGYYSNGIPSGTVYEIIVKKDTISIKEYLEQK